MNSVKTSDRSRRGTQLVTFRLGAESFGLPVASVREILRPIDLFCVPGMGADVEGVINLRGEIIPVVKLGSLLGVASNAGEQPTKKRRIVILDVRATSLGFFVDEVFEVSRVQAQEIQAPPDFARGAALAVQVVMGIVKIAGRMVVCINPDKLILDDLMTREPAVGA
jgi:chemotaxis signal transduction protein